ncbi:MAG: TolC family protein, partial [Ignavibacteriales bacterium]|nr:TolC family protein [Ignavibacteriales bacterium]
MRTIRLLSFACFIAISPVASQPKYVLTLQQSIDLALKQGYAVQNATSQYLSTKKNYESALRKLRTSVDLNFDLPSFQESLSSQFNPLTQRYEFYQLQTTRIQSTVSINQPIVFTGGTLTFRESVFGREQTSGLGGITQTNKDYFNNFLVEFRQPLLTPNTHRLNSDRNILGLQQVESDFLKNQLDVIYNITESFYAAYQSAQRLAISGEQVKQNEETYKTARNKYSAGLIPEVEVLQSEIDLVTSQNDALNNERDLARANNSLKLLLGLSLSDDIQPVAELTYQPVKIDSLKAVSSALENRSEILNAQRNKELRQIDVDVAESKKDFRFDLSATYGFNRVDSDINKIFQDLGRTRGATLSVSVPLFDWGSSGLEIEAAVVQQQHAIRTQNYVHQQIEQEIIDLLSRIRLAESRIRVLEKSVAVAQKGYDISLERFRSGTINRNDLAQAQQRLTTAK